MYFKSQSPQTGQFNSYDYINSELYDAILKVSIPSNGSIQFLPRAHRNAWSTQHLIVSIPSNGSIQFLHKEGSFKCWRWVSSQSPQTGQFNSYGSLYDIWNSLHPFGLNPLKRVNSILTLLSFLIKIMEVKVSIPSNGSIQFLHIYINVLPNKLFESLNPLKRVNSILTLQRDCIGNFPVRSLSQSPQTGQFNSYWYRCYLHSI